jgi:hypothetical protein
MDAFDSEFVGLFIGEGCIDISQQGRSAHHIRPRLRIALNERDVELLQAIQERYGGSLSYRAQTRSYSWQLTGAARVRRVARLLAASKLPHAKRAEVAIILKAVELWANPVQMSVYKTALSNMKRST